VKWNIKAERKAMISYQIIRNYLSSYSPTYEYLPEHRSVRSLQQ
jgi:hypothetical protein